MFWLVDERRNMRDATLWWVLCVGFRDSILILERSDTERAGLASVSAWLSMSMAETKRLASSSTGFSVSRALCLVGVALALFWGLPLRSCLAVGVDPWLVPLAFFSLIGDSWRSE